MKSEKASDQGQTMDRPGIGEEGTGKRPSPEHPSPDLDETWVDRVRRLMLSWFDLAGREGLPWRVDRDPYKVLVSEVMLVQTTVAAAGPFFSRFLSRFPNVETLAKADEADVLKAWEGLGYYRRARQLQNAARVIVHEHGGRVPENPEALLQLPGVGRYIAGAVGSIAFDRPEPILEANTQRVLSRWLCWPEDVRSSASQARLWLAASRLVPPEGAGRFNQAMMDLGATVCTPKAPLCLACPVSEFCLARQEGRQDELPVRASPIPPLEVSESCVIVVDEKGRFLVVRRSPGGLWEHFAEFPTVHRSGVDPAGRGVGPTDDRELASHFLALTGVALEIGPEIHKIRYGVTKHKVTLQALQARCVGGSPAPGPGLSSVDWLAPEALEALPRSAATRRLSSWAASHPERLRNSGP